MFVNNGLVGKDSSRPPGSRSRSRGRVGRAPIATGTTAHAVTISGRGLVAGSRVGTGGAGVEYIAAAPMSPTVATGGRHLMASRSGSRRWGNGGERELGAKGSNFRDKTGMVWIERGGVTREHGGADMVGRRKGCRLITGSGRGSRSEAAIVVHVAGHVLRGEERVQLLQPMRELRQLRRDARFHLYNRARVAASVSRSSSLAWLRAWVGECRSLLVSARESAGG